MSEPIAFPDPLDVVATVLSGDVSVVSLVPDPRPASFIRLQQVPGPGRRSLVTDRAQVIVEAWGATLRDARNLAERNRTLLLAARGTTVGGVVVHDIQEAAGPGAMPDPTSKQHRYTQTFILALRGSAP